MINSTSSPRPQMSASIRRIKPTSRSSEYRNLRHVVPSLRRQRDVDKVEVVTEAARYIDHLHKTLIERFVVCGIPNSLKDVLGTDDASELGSQHIMNLVTSMAAAQRQEEQRQQSALEQERQRRNLSLSGPQSHHPINSQHLGLTRPSHQHCAQMSSGHIAQISARHSQKSRRLRRLHLGKKSGPLSGSGSRIHLQQRAPRQLARPADRSPSPTADLKKALKRH